MERPEKSKAVETIEQIKENINAFNKVNKTNINDVKEIFRSTYWVYDTDTSQFAPIKFVQCVGMNFSLYKHLAITLRSKSWEYRGDFGGGGDARERIEKITGQEFTENAHLRNDLYNWGRSIGHKKISGVYKSGVNKGKDKWKFIEL